MISFILISSELNEATLTFPRLKKWSLYLAQHSASIFDRENRRLQIAANNRKSDFASKPDSLTSVSETTSSRNVFMDNQPKQTRGRSVVLARIAWALFDLYIDYREISRDTRFVISAMPFDEKRAFRCFSTNGTTRRTTMAGVNGVGGTAEWNFPKLHVTANDRFIYGTTVPSFRSAPVFLRYS